MLRNEMIHSTLISLLLIAGGLGAKKTESQQSAEYDLFTNPPSHNFVIRWAFQEICDFVYDPRHTPWPSPMHNGKTPTFNPKDVKPGDMIFVRDAHWFFKTEGSKIEVPYFILTSGEYLDTFTEKHFKYLEKNPLILGWFTIHPPERFHERVFALPLGIIQFQDLYTKRIEVHEKFLRYRRTQKKQLLYMNCTDWRNPERKRIREIFLAKPFCDHSAQCPFEKYIKDTAQHKFSVAPPGLGPDLYRIYECLMVGTIPIVKHSYLDWLYEGLPVLFINDWSEVTEEFLHKEYARITAKKYNPEKLYMDYWLKYVASTRKRVWDDYRARVGK